MLEDDWYNNPEVLDFCKQKGVLPPPFWNPDGESGEWYWEEDEKIINENLRRNQRPVTGSMTKNKARTSKEPHREIKGMWMWRKDVKEEVEGLEKKKSWIRRLLGL